MGKITKNELIIRFLKDNKGKKFTAKQIAESIFSLNPEFFAAKRSKFNDDKSFIQQLSAESSYAQLQNYHNFVRREKDPVLKKDLLWYEEAVDKTHLDNQLKEQYPVYQTKKEYLEQELYPILIEWLKTELGLYSLRIDEKKSRNSKGQNGNKWLHPDIVAMKVLDKHWDKVVKDCIKASSSQRVELLSFEVKKEITMSNVREYFFQTVSNSSWANEGFLVATDISSDAKKELRVLSPLHGIGVILLDPEQPDNSEILLPARHKLNIDWQSINRIVMENKDFKNYIEYVETYYSSNKIYEELWNK